jgi:hypothetical protein
MFDALYQDDGLPSLESKANFGQALSKFGMNLRDLVSHHSPLVPVVVKECLRVLQAVEKKCSSETSFLKLNGKDSAEGGGLKDGENGSSDKSTRQQNEGSSSAESDFISSSSVFYSPSQSSTPLLSKTRSSQRLIEILIDTLSPLLSLSSFCSAFAHSGAIPLLLRILTSMSMSTSQVLGILLKNMLKLRNSNFLNFKGEMTLMQFGNSCKLS